MIWPRCPKYLAQFCKILSNPNHARKYLCWNPCPTELSSRTHTYFNRVRNLPLNFRKLTWPGKKSTNFFPIWALPELLFLKKLAELVQQNYMFRYMHIIPKHIQSRLKLLTVQRCSCILQKKLLSRAGAALGPCT